MASNNAAATSSEGANPEQHWAPLQRLGPGKNAPETVNAVIEIPKGSSNKCEFSADEGVFVLDRVLYAPLFYPCDYGWIPQTREDDGDPLDVLVLMQYPTFAGCVVPARPVGALRTRDEDGSDLKIIAACAVDPHFDDVHELEDVDKHLRMEIAHFFDSYKRLENKDVDVFGWEDRNFALQAIRDGLELCRRWRQNALP